MNNDYERYDFWHREMKSIKPAKLIPNNLEKNKVAYLKNHPASRGGDSIIMKKSTINK